MKDQTLKRMLRQMLPIATIAVLPTVALLYSGNYLLFHTWAELFVAATALVVFSIAWHTRDLGANDYLTFIGMAAMPFALVIMLHALSYKGMPSFPRYDANLPTQLWLISRTMLTSAFLIAPLFAIRRLRYPWWVLLGYSAAALVLVTMALTGRFPDALIEGRGLTPFKIWMEYGIIAATLLGAVGLTSVRRHMDPFVRTILYGAMAATVLGELAFTLYTDPYGMWNRAGHFMHILGFVGVYAALVLASLETPLSTLFRRLTEREIDLAAAFQREHDIAETLQTAMAFQPERVEGLALAHKYLPAGGVGRIGGDFYDLFRVSDRRVAFVIGDVCGKGLAAASTTLKVRSVLRAVALSESDPARVLERTNTYLVGELDDSKFVTAAFGTIETDTGQVRCAIAGHPEPIVCGRPQITVPDSCRAMPLGIHEPLGAVSYEFRLSPGETMVLVTDGVLDAPGALDRFGIERVSELLHEHGCAHAPELLLDLLLEAVGRHSANHRDDDLALLALRYVPV